MALRRTPAAALFFTRSTMPRPRKLHESLVRPRLATNGLRFIRLLVFLIFLFDTMMMMKSISVPESLCRAGLRTERILGHGRRERTGRAWEGTAVRKRGTAGDGCGDGSRTREVAEPALERSV
ncbi:hypothetical protein DFH07DRAFT_951002 [Mycena maculata]|uniref:Transmembrane protein n=1 Tax=Mycena maculata TaxID=230809 RepID=A0AAD7K641_9AGAR|nr:hypothetical protein DFH07DRAFT_951002 [Mycena maculata]